MGRMSDLDIDQREGDNPMQHYAFVPTADGGWVDAKGVDEVIAKLHTEIQKLQSENSELRAAAAGLVDEAETAAEIAEFGGQDQPDPVDIDGPGAGRI